MTLQKGCDMHAYDYDRQRWVTGQQAERLIEYQEREERELRQRDPDYVRWVRKGGAA
jgi:hypothetical protein